LAYLTSPSATKKKKLFFFNGDRSTIKVDGREGSVQCPDSTLALKVAVLKQAAGLAMKEQTTVRIPIPVAGESESFGVYAVPGLESHVFVGPFTQKSRARQNSAGPAELICLDDDDVTEVRDRAASKQVSMLLNFFSSTISRPN
jgi:hypothetical protein